jgi:two-component system CheB/CheR fusion protein
MPGSQEPNEPAFAALLDFIKTSRSFDLTGYKRGSLLRRVQKRMAAVDIHDIADYLDYLEVHPDEYEPLFDSILINVTSFFRDEDSWECISRELIPNMLAQRNADGQIRIWSAGCASGEEAYSIAMLLAEAVGLEELTKTVKIYATDVDESALAAGRRAVYSAHKLESVPSNLKTKYFQATGENYTVCPELRRSVIFGRHDLVQDAPISRIDLLICRNTLMYFNTETQGRILSRFNYALSNRGYLFVGKAEMLSAPSNLFYPAILKYRIFSKINRSNQAPRNLNSTLNGITEQGLAEIGGSSTLCLEAFECLPTAQVILDNNGYLVLANQSARSMFNLVMTDIGRPLQDLEMSYRPMELRSIIERAHSTGQSVTISKVDKYLPGAKTQFIDIQVDPLCTTKGTSISFADVTSQEKLKDNFKRALKELEITNQELHSAQEELETTNEELQSTNEELETTNEELQSSNEELETMNEELASTNDELEVTNAMLRSLSTTVGQDKLFMESILESVGSAIIAVDTSFIVRLWNHRAQDLWGLRTEEAVGNKLNSLDIGLPLESLEECLKNNLANEPSCDKLELKAINRRGQHIQVDIKISPIRPSAREPITAFVLLIEEKKEH